jgi:hypothetical protein
LVFSHACIAGLLNAEEFALSNEDAKPLAEGVAGVLAVNNVKMTPKQEAYALLIEAAAMVYPPMFAAWIFRLKAEAEQKRKAAMMRPVAPQQSNIKPPGFDPSNIVMPRGE